MAYRLEGSMLEVCSCKIICPCWVGEDPDGGICKGTVAWHFEKGHIDGVDVAGLTFAILEHIPGNILEGNWRVVAFVDERATPEQEEALLNVYTGKLGGPVADLAQLIGEVVGVERAPIIYELEKGKGRLRIGTAVAAETEPLQGATGELTTLNDTVFSTIPGSPAFVAQALSYKATSPALGINVDLEGHNAIQGNFLFEG